MPKLPTLSQPAFDLVFGYVYTGLAVNLSMAVANAPLAVALALVRDPGAAWPFLVLLSPTLAPAIAGAFAAYGAAGDGGTSPFREFWSGWRRCLGRALVIGAGCGVLVLLVGVDLAATAGRPIGALLAPPLLLVAALAPVVAVLMLAGLAAEVPLPALAKLALYLAVRRWPLSLLTLAALAGASAFVLAQPVFGILLGVSPLLFIAFGNSRAALARAGVTP